MFAILLCLFYMFVAVVVYLFELHCVVLLYCYSDCVLVCLLLIVWLIDCFDCFGFGWFICYYLIVLFGCLVLFVWLLALNCCWVCSWFRLLFGCFCLLFVVWVVLCRLIDLIMDFLALSSFGLVVLWSLLLCLCLILGILAWGCCFSVRFGYGFVVLCVDFADSWLMYFCFVALSLGLV